MRSRSGFSLPEALLAMLIISVAVLALVALSLTALKTNQKTSDALVAESLADQSAEQFIYGLPASGDPFWANASYASPYQTDSVVLGSTKFDREIRVWAITNPAAPMHQLEVTVRWWAGDEGREGYGQLSRKVVRFVANP